MNSLIVSAPESAAIMNGSKTAFVVPCKVQPPSTDYELLIIEESQDRDFGKAKWIHMLPDFTMVDGGQPLFKAPYKIGQKIYLREPHRIYLDDKWQEVIDYQSDGNYEPIYMSDGDGFQVFNKDGSERMIPWLLCPKKHARHWVTPVNCEVVRCRDMSEEQIEQIVEFKGVPTGGDDEFVYYRDYLSTKDNSDFPWIKETSNGILLSWYSYVRAKHGQSFWDNNGWLFFYTTEMSEK